MTKTTEADAGCYKVVGTNDAGSAECMAWMAVFGKLYEGSIIKNVTEN